MCALLIIRTHPANTIGKSNWRRHHQVYSRQNHPHPTPSYVWQGDVASCATWPLTSSVERSLNWRAKGLVSLHFKALMHGAKEGWRTTEGPSGLWAGGGG